MSTRIRQMTSVQKSKKSVSGQSKATGPSEQQRNIDTDKDIPVIDHRHHKRKVADITSNVEEHSKTSATLKVENETAKADVIVLVSDEELSDEWEDYPKPDPQSSRGGKAPSQPVGERAGAKAKRRGGSSLAKPPVPKGKRRTRGKRSSTGKDSTYLGSGSGRHIQQSLTDHFPVRRSTRKCKSMIEDEKQEEMIHKLLSRDEEGLKVVDIADKGRGVAPTRAFKRGELLCEYAGELLTEEEAKRVEEEYRRDPSIGCYMYYFSHQGKRYCVDATKESGRMGRLVNHSRKQANVVTRIVTLPDRPCLCLMAARDIQPGEELQYDYGDHSKAAEEAHPWLKY